MATSRLTRFQEKKSRRGALIYLLLSVVFVFAMVRWGVPGFIQLLAWWTGADKPTTITSSLKVRPQTPALTPLPEATFSAKIKVSGVAQPGVKVRLISNGINKDVLDVENDGRFVFESVALLPGKNILGVQAVNKTDLESDIAQAEIFLDQQTPEMEISEPADESDFFGQTQKNIQIVGTMKERGEIDINGNFVVVSSNGDFNYRYSLTPGMNEITVTATDTAGNKTTKLLRLRFTQ